MIAADPPAPYVLPAGREQLHFGPPGPPPPYRLRDDAGVPCEHASPDEARRLVALRNRRRAEAAGRAYPEPVH